MTTTILEKWNYVMSEIHVISKNGVHTEDGALWFNHAFIFDMAYHFAQFKSSGELSATATPSISRKTHVKLK